MVKNRMIGKPKQQPDFAANFHQDSAAPIDYVSRDGALLLHDVAYLSSYLQDARFRSDRLMLRRKTLSIPLKRDRWELYRKGDELKAISSLPTIHPVICLSWEFQDLALPNGRLPLPRDLFIGSLFLGE